MQALASWRTIVKFHEVYFRELHEGKLGSRKHDQISTRDDTGSDHDEQ